MAKDCMIVDWPSETIMLQGKPAMFFAEMMRWYGWLNWEREQQTPPPRTSFHVAAEKLADEVDKVNQNIPYYL